MVHDLNTDLPAAQDRQVALRKKIPASVARVLAALCSGCEVCIVFCPVDCIVLLPDPSGGVNRICEVVEDSCIGCKICPRECPWEAIEMVPYRALTVQQEAAEAQ